LIQSSMGGTILTTIGKSTSPSTVLRNFKESIFCIEKIISDILFFTINYILNVEFAPLFLKKVRQILITFENILLLILLAQDVNCAFFMD